MTKHFVRLLGGIALLAACASASATKVGGVAYLNFDFGGDTLEETNQGDITAGGLVHVAGGLAIYDYAGEHLETQLTIGMKADSVSASNGSVEFYRWPIELMQFYKNGMFRLGGGLSYHLNPELECDIDDVAAGCDYTEEFDNALGYVVQADFVVPLYGSAIREFTIGARATFIDYEEKETGVEVDGDSVGVSLGVSF